MEVVDYTTCMTRMERMLKDMYQLTLRHEMEAALAMTPELITEARMLQGMLKVQTKVGNEHE